MELVLILFAATLAATAIASVIHASLASETRPAASVETLQPRRRETTSHEDLKQAA